MEANETEGYAMARRKEKYLELAGGMVLRTDRPDLWPDAKSLSSTEGKARKLAEAKEWLLSVLKPGDTVYTVLRHVAASGMSRRIDLYAIKDNEPIYLSGYAAEVMDRRLSDKKGGGIEVGGGGMDMGFHLVYNLGQSLWPEGTKEAHGVRNGGPDNAGGYALKHKWL
jgi:hypothetical protein